MSFEYVDDCVVCDGPVRYVGYVPHIPLCRECGFPDPHPRVKADDDGYAYVESSGSA